MAMPFIDSGALRTVNLNATNDATAGGSVAGGTGLALYQGLVGKRVWLDNREALRLSTTATGTLYSGIYQYVQFLSTATAAPALGQIAFWLPSSFTATDDTQYVVTTDGSATAGDGLWAGIILNAVTKGNFGWIQIAGLASVKFKAGISSAVAGNLAVVTTTSNTADAVADTTAITAGSTAGAKEVIGVCQNAPASSTVSRVFITRPIFY